MSEGSVPDRVTSVVTMEGVTTEGEREESPPGMLREEVRNHPVTLRSHRGSV